MDSSQQKRKFGMYGTLLGLLALGIALFHFFAGPIAEPPPLETVVAETTVNLKKALTAALEGEEYHAPAKSSRFDIDRGLDISIIVIGFLAICLGVMAFIRREDWRANVSALALGSSAILFQFTITLVAIITAIVIIGIIVSALDFS